MKVVKPSFNILYMPDGEKALALIERIGRVAYKSEDKIDPGECCPICDGKGMESWGETFSQSTAAVCPDCSGGGWKREPSSHKFIKMILKADRKEECRKHVERLGLVDPGDIFEATMQWYQENPPHESVIEHCSATVLFTTSRGVTHELVRHRLCAFTQECVAGHTKVTKKYTIRELYERTSTPHGKTHNKTLRLRSCRENGTITRNKMVQVFFKGSQPTHRVTTKLGYTIEATGNHEFMLPDGSFRRLAEISVGESVMVNGRPSLLNITDVELKHYYLNIRQSPQEIADSFGAPYVSVLRRLKQLGIFVKHRNDKNPEKYNRNHTRKSYEKMRGTILQQYQDGREPWNKDVREGEHPSVDRQAASLRKNQHRNPPGEDNSNWQGGVSSGYYLRLVPPGPCELCSASDAAEVHHIDHNRRHNERSNLIRICINCHDKLHHGWHVGAVAHPDEIVSIEYVGEQDVYDIEMAAPYHNYVANGFVVHNSTRYCDYNKGKFGGEITVINQPAYSSPDADVIGLSEWGNGLLKAEQTYRELRKLGFQPQIARGVLPQDLKAEIVCTANFREWRHIFRMRCSLAAHPDMRALMIPLREEFRQRVPIIFDEV